ncbi:MAG: hypothetical protein DMF52_13890 [Acidobacteria bacterium]|nr:MAG: hypothetical protein DMF52_13890 [Acidobacteriota bacterium]
MNRLKTNGVAFIAFLCATTLALAGASTTQAKPNYGFEKMKALVGAWQGTTKDGKAVKVTYSLVADGSAVMETLEPGNESAMITMYHPDGGRVMMTHYCSAHNQPRMRAEAASADPKSLTFNFVDATNLSSPTEGHMERLVVNFVDSDHFAQEWTFKVKDQKQVDLFTFQRN